MAYFIRLLLVFFSLTTFCQNDDLVSGLYENYKDFKETTLKERRIKYADIEPLITELSNNPLFAIQQVGKSIEGRGLNLISMGSGQTNIFLWSQMHGDEPTATQALFDIFNFFKSSKFQKEKDLILKNTKLHFLPMVNPDGAENYERRNALGIDINRDAVRLQSPESRTLKRIRDSLNADFGFNLHDQSTYYNVERTENPASVSYLAPAYSYDKDINDVRGDAMKIIVLMNRIIQNYAKGQVGRYNDDFEPRAFGDNFQKWGTSTILIESGGYLNDIEKQEIRRLNFVSILSALYSIAIESYDNIPLEDYEKIPQNDRKLFDLKLMGVTYELLGNDYILDIGINHQERDLNNNSDFYNVGRISDLGDLSTYFGYRTFNAEGYKIVEGKKYPKILKDEKAIDDLDLHELLKSGYTYIQIEKLPEDRHHIKAPINIIEIGKEAPNLNLKTGGNATFLLKKDNNIEYAVINGFLIDLNAKKGHVKNALIFN